MAVQGEKYLLMMGYIHFLCLLAARYRLQWPLRPGRAAVACILSSVHSLLSLLPALPFAHPLCVFCSLISSGVIAFGKRGVHAFLPQLMAGLLFSGACAFLTRMGAGPSLCLLACTGLCMLLCIRKKEAEWTVLDISFRGKNCCLRAIRDTGNSLSHPALGLPVIVCSVSSVRRLLPENFDPAPEKLLPGFTLVSARTVKGMVLLPCFVPDAIRDAKTGTFIPACIGVCGEPIQWGLIPGSIQIKEEKGRWKRKPFSEKTTPPSVNG